MDHKADKFGYLRKSGAIGVCTKAIPVKGSSRGKGALGSSSVETVGLAKRAKIEGNESKMYDKLEKRTTKSMKEGGSEKELRRGHNFSGLIGLVGGGGDSDSKKRTGPTKKQLANPKFREKHSVAAAKGDLKATKKAGGDVTAAKQGLAAAKGERKDVFNTMKAARKDVKAAGNKTERQAAKGVLKATKQEAKSRFAGKYKAMQAKRKAKKDSGGTGIGDILGGGLF